MSEVLIISLMIGMAMSLYIAIKLRVKKDENWKKCVGVAGGIFILLAVFSKS